MKFIHLTDTHLVAEGDTLMGLDPAERLAGAVASINADHKDAAFVIVTGDLTNTGRAADYAAFKRQIAGLAMPAHFLLGNHDDRQAFFAAFPHRAPDDQGFAQSVIKTKAGRMLLLDTHNPHRHDGSLCEKRLDWLNDQLTGSTDHVFIFMHHPPMPVGLQAMDSIRLNNAKAFLDILSPHITRIRHLFFGHVHRPIWGTWQGIAFSCMRGLNHQIALDMAAPPDVYPANTEPPAYGVVLVGDDHVTVHMHDYTSGGETFEV